MKIVFRVDASLEIGTGHVMRCLTLADALSERAVDCQFICRAHKGNLAELIRSKGYRVHIIPVVLSASDAALSLMNCGQEPALAHSAWLGATQAEDALACSLYLAAELPDWLVVDHYALDARWERMLAPYYQKLLVIDDLADRPHIGNALLDQTYGRDPADYHQWVPADCHLMCGSQFALLRPEFAVLRPYSLQRRTNPVLRELLITMGGVDKDNATQAVLQALRGCALPQDCRITVVMGATAPWLEAVQQQAQIMPWATRVLVGVSDMAQLMADSDLAIGAAGATTWERCCLGLPAIMLPLAINQRQSCAVLATIGAGLMIADLDFLETQISEKIEFILENDVLKKIAKNAMHVVDGCGIDRLIAIFNL